MVVWNSRLSQSTRGKVLLLIKKQGSCTVAFLSQQLDLTPNAIRQHLSALERDNLVFQQPIKTGPNKPALAYSLTPHADLLFPKQYESLLACLVKELVHREGSAGVCHLLAQLGDSSASYYVNHLAGLTFDEKAQEVGRIMEESGSILDWERTGEALIVRDANCPYAGVARDHPEVCEVQRSFLQRLLHPATVGLSCDHQKSRCQFHIRLPGEKSVP